MKAPRDGWDRDELEVLESEDLGRELEAVRARHALSPEDTERLLARIQQETRHAKAAPGGRFWQSGLMLAAAAVILVAGASWMLRRGGGRPPEPTLTPSSTVAVATPSPVFHLLLEPPAIKVSPSALAWRGPGSENPLLADLRPAFDAFRAADYSRADREFAAVSGKYPASIEIAFYRGVARLFTGDVQGAIANLTAAEKLADSAFAWEVAWYRAVADERAGDLKSARAGLTNMCARPDPRAKTACDALKRLPEGR